MLQTEPYNLKKITVTNFLTILRQMTSELSQIWNFNESRQKIDVIIYYISGTNTINQK